MLRIGYMPSDFHPVFLILGEASDLLALARSLEDFADLAAPLAFGADIPCASTGARLTIVPTDSLYGLRIAEDGAFRWGLNAWQASQIAMRLETLAGPDQRSGSDIFELGVEGEIPVKVSRGEFTDDFLRAEGVAALRLPAGGEKSGVGR